MAFTRKIPRGCGDCGNKILELNNLVARCMKCGWSRNLQSINDYLMSKSKQRR